MTQQSSLLFSGAIQGSYAASKEQIQQLDRILDATRDSNLYTAISLDEF